MSDPYVQNKAELIAKRLHDGVLHLSRPVRYAKGDLGAVLDTVRMLQHHCGFPEKGYQVKFNADIGALRLSDYHTRHVCEPGQHFWLLDSIIMGGSLEEHAEIGAIVAHQLDLGTLDEADFTAQNWAIVTALKALRNG